MMASEEGFRSAKSGIWGQLTKLDAETSLVRNLVCEDIEIKSMWKRIVAFASLVSLKFLFPRHFLISLQKEFSIMQMGSWLHERWFWNLVWCRALRVLEDEDVVDLLACIEAYTPCVASRDFVS